MIEAYKSFWTRAFDFKGRSSRSDYWWACLAYYLVGLCFTALAGLIESLAFLSAIYSLAAIIPGISMAVRRVRDMGNSWQWIFITLIPIVGAIWFLVILCRPSVPIA